MITIFARFSFCCSKDLKKDCGPNLNSLNTTENWNPCTRKPRIDSAKFWRRFKTLSNAITRQPIGLESCSNHLLIQKVFKFRF